MQEALREVKAALGPEAVILDTTGAPGEVVVTAATDPDESAVLAPPGRPAAGDRELLGEVRLLLGAVRDLVGDHWRRRLRTLAPAVAQLHRRLVAQGMDGVIAAALVRATAERLETGVPLDEALAGTLGQAAPRGEGPRVRVFLGPPGDGKTTTIAKLAARAGRAGTRVAIVGTDTYRIGATAELESYGRALGVPVVRATDPEELRAALAAADAEVVLVDTAGCGPGQEAELGELGGLVAAAGEEAGRTLVVSAAHGMRASSEAWEAFAALGPDSCVLTKLDVAPAGPMVGICWRRGVPVTHVATGRRIPDDLERATPDRLARCLLAA
jgi:flagellar biosynthesis protein FlhF